MITSLHSRIHGIWQSLPRGGSLPEEVWERRHRGILILLWCHVVGLWIFAVVGGHGLLHSLAEALIIALAAVVASDRSRGRIVRSGAAALGLLVSSALLVHFSGGYVEMHFHFFVMVGVITLYQDWVPFLVAIGFVVLHHGIIGTLHPRAVYNHPGAWQNPWRWAGIHGLFVVAASIAQLTAWRLNERGFLDSLTGLPNRALFSDRIDHALARGYRDDDPTAVLFLDLDEFKTINDSLGHHAGDRILVGVADRIRAVLRSSDSASRLGGDEFALLLERTTVDGARRVAERVMEALRAPFNLDGRQVVVTASIGVVGATDQRLALDILRDADAAMYKAKASGKNRIAVFECEMRRQAMDRLDLQAELARALQRDEFELHYQPTFSLDSHSVRGMEALLRWRHPTRGLLSPSQFIPYAEENGLIVPIGQWVIAEACRQASVWAAGSPVPLMMKVNLSATQFQDSDLAQTVAVALGISGLSPDQLVLEITETVLMHHVECTLKRLEDLKEIGIKFAIDDFGTGYSSFSYLRRFPVDILKIDKSFVDRLADGPEDAAVARAIVRLGRTLGLETIAEGIETADQAHQLERMGCGLGQGYYFSPPKQAKDIHELLERASLRVPA